MPKTYKNPVHMNFEELAEWLFPQPLLRARADALNRMQRGPDIFLTIQETAGLLKVSERTMRDWIAKHKVPTTRVDGVIRIRRDKLLAALEKYEIRAA